MTDKGIIDEKYTLAKSLSKNIDSKKETYTAYSKGAKKIDSVIKFYKINGANQLSAPLLLENEFKILLESMHPNIIRTLGFNGNGTVLRKSKKEMDSIAYIAFEYLSNGSLVDFIKFTGKLEENLARYYFQQLLEALTRLHGKGYTHRCLRPEHLLLDDNFNLKLSNLTYGVHATKYRDGRHRTKVDNAEFWPPEMHAYIQEIESPNTSEQGNKSYNGVDADLFACASTLFYMLAGARPFESTDGQAGSSYLYFMNDTPEKFWDYVKKEHSDASIFTEDLVSLFTFMFAANPKERPTIADIKGHNWYKLPILSEEEVKICMKEKKNMIKKQMLEEITSKNAENVQSKLIKKKYIRVQRNVIRNHEESKGEGSTKTLGVVSGHYTNGREEDFFTGRPKNPHPEDEFEDDELDIGDEKESFGRVQDSLIGDLGQTFLSFGFRNQYNPQTACFTEFFVNTASCQDLFDESRDFASDVGSEYTVESKKNKLRIEIPCPSGDFLNVTIRIFYVEKSLYCVRMTRNNGEMFDFYELFDQFKLRFE